LDSRTASRAALRSSSRISVLVVMTLLFLGLYHLRAALAGTLQQYVAAK
jgi:hypothetical protein